MKKEISLVKREGLCFGLIATSLLLAALNTLFINNEILERVLAVIGLILSALGLFTVLRKHEADDEMSIAHRRQAGCQSMTVGWIGMFLLLLMIGMMEPTRVITIPVLKSAIEIALSISMFVYVLVFVRLEYSKVEGAE